MNRQAIWFYTYTHKNCPLWYSSSCGKCCSVQWGKLWNILAKPLKLWTNALTWSQINPAVHISLSFCKLFIAVRADGSEETNIVCCFKACWPVCLCAHTCRHTHTHTMHHMALPIDLWNIKRLKCYMLILDIKLVCLTSNENHYHTQKCVLTFGLILSPVLHI